jgi:SAM-dependent methyltransferase
LDRIRTLFQVVRERGVIRTLAFLVSYLVDLRFEARYGTDTVSWVRIEDLEIVSDNKERAVDYQPTQRLPLMRLLRTLDIPRDKVFIDLGSGKGNALLIAADFGFETLRGVEFSSELCRVAEDNCEKYRKRTGSGSRFRIIESDVTLYEFTDEAVIYLFNPFDGLVLGIVLKNLMRSLHTHPRRVWIIYRRPLHLEVVERFEGIRFVAEYHSWGSDFAVCTADCNGGGLVETR